MLSPLPHSHLRSCLPDCRFHHCRLTHCRRWHAFRVAISATTLISLLFLCSSAAEASDGEVSVGPQTSMQMPRLSGASAQQAKLPANDWSLGAFVSSSFHLDDTFALGFSLDYTLPVTHLATNRISILTLLLRFRYTIDLFSLVPYAEIAVGPAVGIPLPKSKKRPENGLEPVTAPLVQETAIWAALAQATFGLQYRYSREASLGAEVAVGTYITHAPTFPLQTTVRLFWTYHFRFG